MELGSLAEALGRASWHTSSALTERVGIVLGRD